MLAWNEILIRLALASLFGALIGLERERKHWAAGLRTHMMVCVGSSLIMIVSAYGFFDILKTPNVDLDPSRIAAQVVSGIGFLGAGTILFLKQGTIKGLTTASGLWTVAGIGLATGSGLYFAAGAATVIAIIILWGLQPIEKLYFKKYGDMTLKIISHTDTQERDLLSGLQGIDKLKIQSFTFERRGNDFLVEVKLENINLSKIDDLIKELKKDPDIKEVSWFR
ncbi:MAG TPA: MgtC/SapB family protein [Edaphocola sp.]|nr:MgtC/SapB family protein [Edaphocola sp.]